MKKWKRLLCVMITAGMIMTGSQSLVFAAQFDNGSNNAQAAEIQDQIDEPENNTAGAGQKETSGKTVADDDFANESGAAEEMLSDAEETVWQENAEAEDAGGSDDVSDDETVIGSGETEDAGSGVNTAGDQDSVEVSEPGTKGQDISQTDSLVEEQSDPESKDEKQSQQDTDLTKQMDEVLAESSDNTTGDFMTFQEFLAQNYPDSQNLSKEEWAVAYLQYLTEKEANGTQEDKQNGEGTFANDYLEVAVDSTGRFTIGNVRGNPNYTTDDNQILVYGHPSPGTSETLIKIEDSEYFFEADAVSVSASGRTAVASMTIQDYNVKVVETLALVKSGNANYEDTVKISYKVINNNASALNIGVRIMVDTMLANNDRAPFKVLGTGNLTTIRNYYGADIPASYQVYDDLDAPTTIATGYLKMTGTRTPDEVQFTNWGAIKGSNWDYTGDIGSDLGDSAVAVKFYPVSVGANKSSEVSTCYGVGLGSGISYSGKTLTSKQIGVTVKSSETGSLITNATVNAKLDDGTTVTGTTDGNGYAVVDLTKSDNQKIDFTVSANDYTTRSISQNVKGGSQVALVLKPKGSTKPMVVSAKIGSTDLLSNTVHYIENKNKNIEKANKSDIKEITIDVASDMDDCVYYLVENEKVLQKNETGKFKLKTVKTDAGTVIESLSADGNRYVQVVSKKGEKSNKVKLGIKVSIPSAYGSVLSPVDLWPYGKTNVATGTLGALLLGDKVEFGIGKAFGVEVKISDDGKVRIGVNIETPDNNADAKKVMESLSKARLGQWKQARLGDISARSPSVSMGSVRGKIEVAGYGEGTINNGIAKVDVGIAITASVDGKYTTNYYYVVPLYVEVGGGASITGETKVNIYSSDLGWKWSWYSGSIAVEPYLYIEGGVGSKGIASLGIQGKGTLHYSYDFMNKRHLATLSGQASIEAGVWKFTKSLKLAEGTLKIYDSNDHGSVEDQPSFKEQLVEIPFTLASRDYLLNESRNLGADDDMSLTASTEADPQVVTVNGTRYKFWIAEDTDRSVSNGSKLVYSVFEDDSWSEAKAVDDDGTGDYDASVYPYQNQIYIVYNNMNQVFDDETVTVEDMENASEIALAILDTETGTMKTEKVTDNDYMDAAPQIAVTEDGTAYIAWYENTGDFTSDNTENRICYVTYQNAFGSVRKVECGSEYVSQIALSLNGTVPHCIYKLAGSYNDIDETSVHLYEFDMTNDSEPKQIEADEMTGNIYSGSLNGKEAVVWNENGTLCYRYIDEETVHRTDESIPSLPAEFYIVDDTTNSYLLYNSYDAESEQQVIYAITFDGSGWSDPKPVKRVSCDAIRSLSAIYENETFILNYLAITYDEDGNVTDSQMVEGEGQDLTDLSLESVEFDETAFAYDSNLPLKLTISNNGNTVADHAVLHVEGRWNSADYDLQDLAIAPGQTKEIQVSDFNTFTGDYDEIDTYLFRLDVDDDYNTGNNETEESVGYTNITLSDPEQVIVDGQEYYAVEVKNEGVFDIENLRVKILADSQDGIIIEDQAFDVIEKQDYKTVYVSADALEDCSCYYAYLSSDTPIRDEDTYWLFSCSNETMTLLSEQNLTIEAGEGGTITAGESGVYNSFDKVSLEAQPDEGYVFDGWEYDSGYMEEPEDASAVFELGESDAIVKATFIPDTQTQSISFESDEMSLQVGDEAALNIVTEPELNRKQVTWTSDQEDIVSVSKSGVISAHAVGTSTIRATSKKDDSIFAECTVSVKDVPISSLRMIVPEIELDGLGDTDTLDLLITPENASEKPVWKSSDEEKVTVEQDGTITAVGLGQAEITAYVPGDDPDHPKVYAKALVQVQNPLTGFDFDKNDVTLTVGQTEKLTMTFMPEDATDIDDATYTNYDDSVVRISASGEYQKELTIEAVGSGTAVIEANINGITRYITVTVNLPCTGFDLNTETLNLYVGDWYYLELINMTEGHTDTFVWTSDNEDVVSVYNNGTSGELYAIAPGKAVITVTSEQGAYSRTCTVNVQERTIDTVTVTGTDGFESEHDYANSMEKIWQYKASGASAVQLTFDSQTAFESGCDYLYVLDQNNTQVAVYTGDELAGKTIKVDGPIVKLKLTTDSSVTRYGFKVTNIRNVYDLSKATVSGISAKTYTGSKITPNVVVKIGGTTLVKGQDYSVTYSNNVNPGKAGITVKGISPSTGTKTESFTIKAVTPGAVKTVKASSVKTASAKIKWSKVSNATGYRIYRYSGGKYTLLKTINSKSTTSATVKNLLVNKKQTIAVRAIAKSGSVVKEGKQKTVSVKTKAPNLTVKNLKATSGKNKVTLKYKKASDATGYVIYVSSKKNSGYKKAATIKKGSTVKYVYKKSGKKTETKYFKVRAYIKSGGKTTYGKYTAPVKAVIKH